MAHFYGPFCATMLDEKELINPEKTAMGL